MKISFCHEETKRRKRKWVADLVMHVEGGVFGDVVIGMMVDIAYGPSHTYDIHRRPDDWVVVVR